MTFSQLLNHELKSVETDECPSIDLLYARGDSEPFGRGWAMNRMQRGQIKVFIVDDNEDAAHLLSDVMQFYGYETMVAHTGVDALALIDRVKPDVAILDLGMPDMNGIQVAERLRASGVHTELLLIALTGWGHGGVRQLASAAGFSFHFVKPADPSALSALIDEEAFRKRVGSAP